MSGVIELGGGSTMAKAISLDNVDFAIDGEVPPARKHRLEMVQYTCCCRAYCWCGVGPFTALAAPGYGDANLLWETASYIKDNNGRVHLRGLLSSTAGTRAAGPSSPALCSFTH